ncbi:MAG TPA: BatA domain-containing protein, partial [Mucilaginibacter sp.]
MQFLNPIWLLAIAAVSIPVIIHLWNIKPGKTLKVGSIALITGAAQKSSRSFKLRDILLLAFRCLLLTLLALLLAIPVWLRYQNSNKAKGWLLMPKKNLKETYARFKPTIDSLTKAGYEFHYFDKDFVKTDLNKILTDSGLNSSSQTLNYWNTIARLDERLPASIPVFVFTPKLLRYFGGNRPAVSLNLHWRSYIPADSVRTWIESAWFTNDNGIKITVGVSKPSGTRYNSYMIQSANEGNSQFNIEVNSGKPFVSLKNGDRQAVAVDTSILRITIFTDNYASDAGYLKAALQTIRSFTRRKMLITEARSESQIAAGQDWVFWLSDRPAGKQLPPKTKNLFSYVPGTPVNLSSRINTNGEFSLPNLSAQVALFKEIKNTGTIVPVLWNDGYGNPLLTKAAGENTTIFQFYSRFNPKWNNLVWSDEFPEILINSLLY